MAKAIFLVEKYQNEKSFNSELLIIQNNNFKADLFINFVNKNPKILGLILEKINWKNEINVKWEYQDLFVEMLNEILKYKNNINNKDLIIFNLIDINISTKKPYGYHFFKYNDFIKALIKKDKNLIKKIFSLNFLNNKTILEVVKEVIESTTDFQNLNGMLTNLIEFLELIKTEYLKEFEDICLFLEEYIFKLLNEFIQSLDKNEKLDWMWINYQYKYICKIISQFCKRLKSVKTKDFKTKLEIITAKILEINKKESRNSKNYSKFSYKWEIPNYKIEELQTYNPDLFFSLLISWFNESFNEALKTKEYIFDHLTWFSIDENGRYCENKKFLCENISRLSQYNSLISSYDILISAFGLWFKRDENFQYLKDMYKVLNIEGAKNIFDNIKVFNHEKVDLSISLKLDNVLSILLKENNQNDFRLSTKDFSSIIPLQFCEKLKTLCNEIYDKTSLKSTFLFIWWLNCEPIGPNIRNKVAHPKQENNQYHYFLGILICFFLTGYILKYNTKIIKKFKYVSHQV